MPPKPLTNVNQPSDEEIEAAARELFSWGERHCWWPANVASYETLDPIGREEFDAIVEHVLMAAATAQQGMNPTKP